MDQIVSVNGLNVTISLTVPLPSVSSPVKWPPKIPNIKLPQLPNILAWLGKHLQDLIALIQKLINMIPEASVRLRLYIKTAAAKTKVFDEVVTV